jgi:hypothetical protein
VSCVPSIQRAFGFLFLVLLIGAPKCAPADDIRERQLEIDVEQLRREVQAQARRIDQLERGTARSTERSVAESARTAPPAPVKAPPWLVAANWDRVSVGMSEAEVAKILGPATSQRAGDGTTTLLLYALEVQEGVFLAGRVEIQAGKVSAVQKPALR